MLVKITCVLASLFFTGTAVWALLPMPSPQPSGLPMAVGAGMGVVSTAMQDADPVDECISACQDAFDAGVANATDDFEECIDIIADKAKDMETQCEGIADPYAHGQCMLRAKLTSLLGTKICEVWQEEEDALTIQDLEDCVEACLML